MSGDVLVEIVAEVRGLGRVGFSGVVVRGALAIGDEVFGTLPADHAERYVWCSCSAVAVKPARLAHPEAAVLAAFGPAALTAIRRSGARPGERVLITGASDVGAIAVQIAKARGMHVTAICDDRDVPFVWDLGADEVFARDRLPNDASFVAVIDTDRSLTPDDVTPDELVALVEHDHVFPR